jgi:hypothetical protein
MAKQERKIDIQKIMEIYKKAGTPGEPHKLMAKLEGSWTTRTLDTITIPESMCRSGSIQ